MVFKSDPMPSELKCVRENASIVDSRIIMNGMTKMDEGKKETSTVNNSFKKKPIFNIRGSSWFMEKDYDK